MIYKYKTEKRSLKYFRNYQNLIELFKSLRDGNVKPTEVKSRQNKKGNPKSKSEDQISVIQNVENIFELRSKMFLT